ncbi:MAG: class I SAM-dependent methyltransferase [Thermoanaerobaculia bacterium]
MPIAVLFPHFDHPAIEERYASWQSQLLLRGDGAKVHRYDAEEPVSYAAAPVETEYVLVITDPLLLAPSGLAEHLREVLGRTDAIAALPVSNEAQHPQQRREAPKAYLTLRELEDMTAILRKRGEEPIRLKWDRSDPAVYLCRTAALDAIDDTASRALTGLDLVISPSDYVHRWSSLRGQVRNDLLSMIPADAKRVLEFGCGEAPLGEALKQRQKVRVVGVEIDPKAAAIARKRIDDVYCGDVRDIVAILDEKFDWIIGGDIVEHLAEPWSFLGDLRRICAPGGHVLLSIPNVAHADIISDLLRGRFDYVYMGLTCVGHLRFFTRRSIEEMMSIAGWSIKAITPQEVPVTDAREKLLAALDAAKIPYSRDDLVAGGYYIVAQNPG